MSAWLITFGALPRSRICHPANRMNSRTAIRSGLSSGLLSAHCVRLNSALGIVVNSALGVALTAVVRPAVFFALLIGGVASVLASAPAHASAHASAHAIALARAQSQSQTQSAAPDMRRSAPPHAATPAAERLKGTRTRERLFSEGLLAHVPVRNIGPTIQSGRIVDIDANPVRPSHFLAAYASGGLWYTENNGQSFRPLFDQEAVMTIGDIAVDWERGTIWVGTGENNSSRSSYAGTGLYVSQDWGETWEHRGLAATHRTGRIVLHPSNPDIVWVAAAGALYSNGPDRGVYRTENGGRTWEKTLYVNDVTGAIDLVMHPERPDVLYAAMWERDRRAWNFVESGSGSGVYRSIDGGRSWTLVSTEESGLPTGDGVGRIGIDFARSNPDVIYVSVDNQNRRPPEDEDGGDATGEVTRDDLRSMSRNDFLALPDSAVAGYLAAERFPDKYDAETVKGMVERREIEPVALVEFVEDANSLLFDTPVIGLEVYRSDDGGASWRRAHEDYLDGVYNSYGYYFGEVRAAPDDEDQVYALGVPILRSDDGGATWKSIGGPHVHADHQALWLNASLPGHIIDGNDGGLNMSYDAGETWSVLNVPPVGQFYAIQVDMAKPYNVYGGLQDNGTWRGPSTYAFSSRWLVGGEYPYDRLGGGDGMQVEVDTRTNEVVYSGSQFGFYSRQDLSTGERQSIRPRHELGERPLRFNWQTPIHLSRHNQDILYYGANRLFRSMNRGADLTPISPDLTRGGLKGDVPYGTLATIDESPLRFGLLYTGSDDGLIYVSRDGGASWQRIDDGLPQELWVSRVEASAHAEGRVYATLNGYRWDHFDAYVYASDDYGASWTRIGTDLPAEPVNVIVEDPANEDVLYVGTDHAVYVSLDRGLTFMGLAADMPKVPVHDLKVQPRDEELVIGTHGRSLFVAPVRHVVQLTPDMRSRPVHVFELDDIRHSERWGQQFASWSEPFEPSVTVAVYARRAAGGADGGDSGAARLVVLDADGNEVHSERVALGGGLNYVEYDLAAGGEAGSLAGTALEGAEPADNGTTYLTPGTWTLRVVLPGGESNETELKVTKGR